MNFLEQFAISTGPNHEKVFQDVTDYIVWETNHGEDQFTPQTSDDVALRTYLLDCRIRGVNRSNLNRIASSLEHFYAWLKDNGWIAESPFKEFNLKGSFLKLKYLSPRHDAFQGLPDKREIARLRALNRLAESTNLAQDVQSMLNGTLETMLGVMTLNTAWISLKADTGLLG